MSLQKYFIPKIVSGKAGFHRWVAPTLRALKNRKDRMAPAPPQHRNTFIEWNYDAELYAFGKRLGEEFNKTLLRQALTERSYIIKEEQRQINVGIEPDLKLEDNIIFVVNGEKRINNYVESYLTTVLPKLPKPYILNIHEFLTSEDSLSNISKHIGADDLILCAEFPLETSVLARGFKSVTEALALSSGDDRANLFIRDFVLTQLSGKDLTPLCTPEDPLGTLAESLRESGKLEPEPRLIGEAGRNTLLAVYQVGMYSDKQFIGRGFGETIEVAKEMAACDSLWRIWDVTPRRKPISFSLELPPKKTSQ